MGVSLVMVVLRKNTLIIFGIISLLFVGIAAGSRGVLTNNPPAALNFFGKQYFQTQQYDKAIDAYTKAIAFVQTKELYHNLGAAFYAAGNFAAAHQAFEQAQSLDARYAKAYYSDGLLYFEEKNYEKAVERLRAAAESDRENPAINFDLAIALVENFRAIESAGKVTAADLADLSAAVSQYEYVISLSPEFPHAQSNLAIVRQVIGEYEALAGRN